MKLKLPSLAAQLRRRLLRVEHHYQRPNQCGPAALKIALSRYGVKVSEARAAKLCRTTKHGTSHASLRRAAVTLGAEVHEKIDANIAQLRHYVHDLREPVIVGWQSPVDLKRTIIVDGIGPDEHYSVVVGVNHANITLADPNWRSPRRRVATKDFLKLWWDTEDGPRDIVRGWMMAIHLPRR